MVTNNGIPNLVGNENVFTPNGTQVFVLPTSIPLVTSSSSPTVQTSPIAGPSGVTSSQSNVNQILNLNIPVVTVTSPSIVTQQNTIVTQQNAIVTQTIPIVTQVNNIPIVTQQNTIVTQAAPIATQINNIPIVTQYNNLVTQPSVTTVTTTNILPTASTTPNVTQLAATILSSTLPIVTQLPAATTLPIATQLPTVTTNNSLPFVTKLPAVTRSNFPVIQNNANRNNVVTQNRNVIQSTNAFLNNLNVTRNSVLTRNNVIPIYTTASQFPIVTQSVMRSNVNQPTVTSSAFTRMSTIQNHNQNFAPVSVINNMQQQINDLVRLQNQQMLQQQQQQQQQQRQQSTNNHPLLLNTNSTNNVSSQSSVVNNVTYKPSGIKVGGKGASNLWSVTPSSPTRNSNNAFGRAEQLKKELMSLPKDTVIGSVDINEQQFREVYPFLSLAHPTGSLRDDYFMFTVFDVARENIKARDRLQLNPELASDDKLNRNAEALGKDLQQFIF